MAYFWQVSFCIHKKSFYLKTIITVSIFTDQGEIKKKNFNLDYLETALSASERAKYLLAGSRL